MIFREKDLVTYMKEDWIKHLLEETESDADLQIRTHAWLKEMPNKRMIYSYLYGDLLQEYSGKKILDVGGGYSSLTKKLVEKNDYWCLDFFAHDDHHKVNEIQRSLSKDFWINTDWYNSENIYYDIVIANDIFPDVDQRLELFIEKYIPYCNEIRLLLTYYNKPKWYTTRRIDDTEILTFLSWDGEITALKLRRFLDRINIPESELREICLNTDSIYKNQRQVCYVVIKGDGHKK